MKKYILTVIAAFLFLNILVIPASAQSQSAKDIFLKKYPNEIIFQMKTADVNLDKQPESFILTQSGNFFLVNSKGAIVLVNTGILSEEYFDESRIIIYAVSKQEKHVAITYQYGPSNTQLYVYRLKFGTLAKSLQLMGDQGVKIDKNGHIHQYWKKYRDEGGWDMVEDIFKWNAKNGKYKGIS